MSAQDDWPPHGRPARYDHGTRAEPPCRCDACRKAKNATRNRSRKLRGLGRSPMLDAEPVRAHLERLRATGGMSILQIARAAAVSQRTVRRLLGLERDTPPAAQVRKSTAARVLALRLDIDVLDPKLRICAAGSARRIQALVVTGRALDEIADEVGMHRMAIRRIACEGQPRVTVRTARRIRDLTARWWDNPPRQDTAARRYRVGYARRVAARYGWLPMAAWNDDIDDPAATACVEGPADLEPDPGVVTAYLAGRVLWSRLTLPDRWLLCDELCRRGHSKHAVATTLHISHYTVDRFWPQSDAESSAGVPATGQAA